MEKVVYVDMKALEERAAVSCWWPVGARTDRKLELIRECAWRLVALASHYNPQLTPLAQCTALGYDPAPSSTLTSCLALPSLAQTRVC